MRTIAFWLSLLLIFMIPWENMITTGSSVTTGARLMGVLVAAFWVGTVVFTGKFRKPHLFHGAVYLYLIWNAMSLFWTVDVDLTIGRLQTYFQLAAMVLILWDLYKTSEALNAGLQAYVLGAYVAIGSTMANYLMNTDPGTRRFAATGFNVNDLGVILALGIPVAWYLAISESNSKRMYLSKWLNYAYVPAAVLTILLTASRGALIATFPAFLFVVWSLARLSFFQRVLVPAVLVLALLALQPLVPQASFERLATIRTSTGLAPLRGRVDIWREGIVVFSEQPLLGVGSGAFETAIGLGTSAHNFILSLLVEVGIIGFGIFAIILDMAFYYARYQPILRSRLWLTVLMVWVLGAATHNLEHRKQIWLFLGLTFVGAGLSVNREESVAQATRQVPQITAWGKKKAHVERAGWTSDRRYHRKRSSQVDS